MSWLFPVAVLAVLIGASWPLGRYMHWAMAPSAPGPIRDRSEAFIAAVIGPRATVDQDWKRYALSMLIFNLGMFTLAYLIFLVQGTLPLNPDGKTGLSADLAFNTAASFTSNTNLQHYSGEQSLSYLTQLTAIMWLQFVSAATGIAAVTALCRALAGESKVGNFYRDLTRATGLILLPLSFFLALALVFLGLPMTFQGAAVAHTLEGAVQTIARGPVAAVVAIKQLGTNGGGFFGPNSSHPLENPGFVSNVIENMAILLIPMATVWMFGRITRHLHHAAAVFAVMLVMLVALAGSAAFTEQAPTQALDGLPVATAPNLEGKELRFGPSAGPLWAVSTTVTSNGSVDAMHDSLNPLTGLMPMIGMWLNVVFGGVGVGFINMFVFIVVTVFLAGLMVGRTPEYLNRKVEAREMKLATLTLLVHPLFIVGGAALFVLTGWGPATIHNPGSHGLSEIVYEFSSAAANNGSGFEGLGDNTVPWNIATGLVMLLGRFIPIIAPLAIAASLAGKRHVPDSAGTFRVDTPLFGVLLLATVVIVGALLFMPLGVLGPIAEYLGG